MTTTHLVPNHDDWRDLPTVCCRTLPTNTTADAAYTFRPHEVTCPAYRPTPTGTDDPTPTRPHGTDLTPPPTEVLALLADRSYRHRAPAPGTVNVPCCGRILGPGTYTETPTDPATCPGTPPTGPSGASPTARTGTPHNQPDPTRLAALNAATTITAAHLHGDHRIHLTPDNAPAWAKAVTDLTTNIANHLHTWLTQPTQP